MVIGLLQPDLPGRVVRLNTMRATAELAFIGGGGALVALVAPTYALDLANVWRVAGIATFLLWAALDLFGLRRLRAGGRRWYESWYLSLTVVLARLGMALFLSCALLPGQGAGARYCTALTLALACSALMFIEATFAAQESGETK